MGLFALSWGGLREQKRQRCHSIDENMSLGSPYNPHPDHFPHTAIQAASSHRHFHHLHHHHPVAPAGDYYHNEDEAFDSAEKENQLRRNRTEQHNLHLLDMMLRSNALASSSSSSPESLINPLHHQQQQVHEHLFYKVVTPSDVGKLNRLVIPKQHAERWFPLEPCLRKKGRLLSFQDVVSRELWWFRYSYWSSSQSYVLTKGWIRFVKDKDLQAGDIISFERGARHELYINHNSHRSRGSRTLSSQPAPPPPDIEAHDTLLISCYSCFFALQQQTASCTLVRCGSEGQADQFQITLGR